MEQNEYFLGIKLGLLKWSKTRITLSLTDWFKLTVTHLFNFSYFFMIRFAYCQQRSLPRNHWRYSLRCWSRQLFIRSSADARNGGQHCLDVGQLRVNSKSVQLSQSTTTSDDASSVQNLHAQSSDRVLLQNRMGHVWSRFPEVWYLARIQHSVEYILNYTIWPIPVFNWNWRLQLFDE